MKNCKQSSDASSQYRLARHRLAQHRLMAAWVAGAVSLGAGIWGVQSLRADWPYDLQQAVVDNHGLGVRIHLWQGADPDFRDQQGRSLLSYTASGQVARLLIKAGADVNGPDASGAMPLHHAARHGRYGVAQVLIQSGAEVSARFGAGGTALHFAVWQGDPRLVALLLEQGAAVQDLDGYGNTPLQLAYVREHTHLVDLLRHHLEQRL